MPQVLKRWVRRQRVMTLNPAALDVMIRPGSEARPDVTLNLFDGGPRTLDLDQSREYPKHTKVWRGRLRGEAGSDVTLVTHGTVMVGTILSNHGLYKIETIGGRLHRLIEIDEESLPRITIPSSCPMMIPWRPLPREQADNSPIPLRQPQATPSSTCWSSTHRRPRPRRAARLRWTR